MKGFEDTLKKVEFSFPASRFYTPERVFGLNDFLLIGLAERQTERVGKAYNLL